MTDTGDRSAGVAAATPAVSTATSSTATNLVVQYDGSRPPTALFEAWTRLGWQAPVPASPPRDAIDWSTPDPSRETTHSIRPFPATGTATLDETRRRDVDALVLAALAVAEELGCHVDPSARPAPSAPEEIDLRDAPAPAPTRVPRLRRSAGARARVRATVPTAEVDEVARVVVGLGASIDHEPEPPRHADDEPLSRVTVAAPASAGDAVMRCLAARSTGTPTIEIITAATPAGRDG